MSKTVEFLSDSLERLKKFPEETRISLGYAIRVAQEGGKVGYAKPLKGLGGGATYWRSARITAGTHTG